MSHWIFPACDMGLKGTLRLFGDYKVDGRENVPSRGPVIVVSNHLSNVDPALVAAAFPYRPAFLAKKELFANPALGWFLRGYGAFPLDRGRADLKALNWALTQINENNRALIVFPEGTRSRSGALQKGHPGAAHLGLTSGVPMIPVGLAGSQDMKNVLRVFMPNTTVRVRIGKPFVIKKRASRISREDMETATAEIMIRIARLLPQEYHGHYRDQVEAPLEVTVETSDSAPETAPAGI